MAAEEGAWADKAAWWREHAGAHQSPRLLDAPLVPGRSAAQPEQLTSMLILGRSLGRSRGSPALPSSPGHQGELPDAHWHLLKGVWEGNLCSPSLQPCPPWDGVAAV